MNTTADFAATDRSASAKAKSIACAVVLAAALGPSVALGHEVQQPAASDHSEHMPAYYENLCVEQIDLGNDGDDWMDALGACRQLAQRLKQLERKTRPNNIQS